MKPESIVLADTSHSGETINQRWLLVWFQPLGGWWRHALGGLGVVIGLICFGFAKLLCGPTAVPVRYPCVNVKA